MRRHIRVSTLILCWALLALAPAVAGSRECTSADIAEPFVLPDGSRHDAGILTICLDRESSPVSFIHRTYVDRFPVAMMTSRRDLEARGDEPPYFMIFERSSNRELRFTGYGVHENDGIAVFRVVEPRVHVEDSVRAAVPAARDVRVAADRL